MRTIDSNLVTMVVQGKPAAWERFVARVGDTVWTACLSLMSDETKARSAFTSVFDALRDNGYSRLRAYDGASSLERFIALSARDILSIAVLNGIIHHHCETDRTGPLNEAWACFERFFQPDIQRIIRARLPGLDKEDVRRDAYQEICCGLIADGYRRLKAYSGKGSFTGFVLQVADRLLIDAIRKTVAPRRSGVQLLEMESLAEHEDIPSNDRDPEQTCTDRQTEALLTQAATALRAAAKTLTSQEQFYLHVVLGSSIPLPPRDVARAMGIEVETVYKLKRTVLEKIKHRIEDQTAVKNWRASV